LLSLLDNGVLKTKLVKLIYLIDLISIEAIGKQISDYEYRFWHYGPYPIDIESTEASEDDIVKNHSFEQDITLLKVSNIATIKKGISKYGNLYSAFHLSEDREEILSKATEWFSQEERNIVNAEAGTTRDSVHTRYKAYGFDFILVDTAGIRKKKKVHENIEFYSVLRSIKAIEESDVCIFMIDATEGMQKQDLGIYYMIEKAKKGMVFLVNKWDLVEKDHKTMDDFKKEIFKRIAPFTDVPIIFTSTISKQRLHKALEMALEVYQNRAQRIKTSKLNEALLPDIEQHPPPAHKGKYIRIKYITQIPTHVPTFAFFCNLPQYVRDPYKRFLENKLRQHFSLHGVPVRLFFRKK